MKPSYLVSQVYVFIVDPELMPTYGSCPIFSGKGVSMIVTEVLVYVCEVHVSVLELSVCEF